MNRRNFLKAALKGTATTLVTVVAGKAVLADVDISKDSIEYLEPQPVDQDLLDMLEKARDAMDAANVPNLYGIDHPKSIWSEKLLRQFGEDVCSKSIVSHPEILRAQQSKNDLYRNLLNNIV